MRDFVCCGGHTGVVCVIMRLRERDGAHLWPLNSLVWGVRYGERGRGSFLFLHGSSCRSSFRDFFSIGGIRPFAMFLRGRTDLGPGKKNKKPNQNVWNFFAETTFVPFLRALFIIRPFPYPPSRFSYSFNLFLYLNHHCISCSHVLQAL